MNISPQGIALIKKFEGFSERGYLCPAGKWTIGYGHAIQESEARNQKSEITPEQAQALLRQDLAPVEVAINRLVKTPLTQNQFDALCSLVYNIGVGAFSKSTLLRLLNTRREATGAKYYADQFHRWVFGGSKKLPGLVARRKAEADLFSREGE